MARLTGQPRVYWLPAGSSRPPTAREMEQAVELTSFVAHTDYGLAPRYSAQHRPASPPLTEGDVIPVYVGAEHVATVEILEVLKGESAWDYRVKPVWVAVSAKTAEPGVS